MLPLSTAIHLSGKVAAPVFHPVAYAAVDALYALGLVEAPSGFIDYVRYPCVADGGRARAVLGFEARHTTRQALDSYVAYRHPIETLQKGDDAESPAPSVPAAENAR